MEEERPETLSKEAMVLELVFLLLRQRKNQMLYESEKDLPFWMRHTVKPRADVKISSLNAVAFMNSENGFKGHPRTLYRMLKRLQEDGYLQLTGRLWRPTKRLERKMDEILAQKV